MKAGDWFTDVHGGIYLKSKFFAVNLIGGEEIQFTHDDIVYRQIDLKLSLLFGNRTKA